MKRPTDNTAFFTTHLPMYLDYLAVEKGLAKNSLLSYGRDLRQLGRWLAERDVEVENVERAHLTRYFQSLRTAGISARSVARALAGIRGFFRFLVSERHLQGDPTENLERPKLWPALPNSLQPSEVDALLGAPDRTNPAGLRDAAMLELLYATGLRVSELIRVKVEDLVLDASFLRTIGKGSKERVVPFGDSARQAILTYLENGRAHFDKRGDLHLFLSNRGRPMSRQAFWMLLPISGQRAAPA
ncbi:MAG TPA: tyrosine-type recombinase/integrase, partial [Thermoanaerobaculia bacterium]